MIKEKFNLTEDENKMCFQIAMRSHTMSAPYCWEKMQALAFLYTMIPVINKYYPEKEDRIEGYKRHWELFNTTQVFPVSSPAWLLRWKNRAQRIQTLINLRSPR